MVAKLYSLIPHSVVLPSILIVAAILRLVGLDWALPIKPHPDESRIVDYAIATAAGQPGVVFSDYGPVPFHVLKAVGWLASLVFSDYALHDPSKAAATYVLARFIAGLFGLGTVVLVYWAGSLAYNRKVGLLAASFLTFTVLAIQLSHSYTVDVILVFWCSLFLVLGLWLIQRPQRILRIALAMVVGIALATKFVALFLLIPLAVALYLSKRQGHEQKRGRQGFRASSLRFSRDLLVPLGIVATTFVVLNTAAVRHPVQYWWLDFQDPNWWFAWNFPAGNHNLLWNLLMSEGTVRPLWAITSMPSIPVLNPVTNLLPWAMGPALLAMAGVGIVMALKRRTPSDWLLLSYLFAAYLAVAGSQVQFIRYVYPMVPALAILAARPVMALSMDSINRSWIQKATVTALVLTLLASALYSFAFTSIYWRPDTRLQAEQWIRENIPPGAVVGVEGPEAFANPFVDSSAYRIHTLPVYSMYHESTVHTYPSSGLLSSILGKRLTLEDNVGRMSEEEVRRLVDRHLQSDYLVITNRLTEMVEATEAEFEGVRNYYQVLFEGREQYTLVQTVKSQPQFWRLTIDDSRAEHTFKIFDHPTIYIFKRAGR